MHGALARPRENARPPSVARGERDVPFSLPPRPQTPQAHHVSARPTQPSELQPQVVKNRTPKQKRVVLVLESSKRAATAYGADFGTQVAYMLIDGLTVNQIATALGCGDDVITNLRMVWLTQIALVEGPDWKPKLTNPRRTKCPKPQNNKDIGLIAAQKAAPY